MLVHYIYCYVVHTNIIEYRLCKRLYCTQCTVVAQYCKLHVHCVLRGYIEQRAIHYVKY